jgi:DNA-binding NarL/FixJ family response regulator
VGPKPHPGPHERSYGRSDETLDIAAVTHLTELTESELKPLGAVSLECSYPVVAVALKEILKEEADVYEGSRQPTGAKDPSCIVLCSNGKDVTSEVRRLVASNPQAPVLVFDMRDDPWLVRKALQAGASGFLHAGMHPGQIVGVLRLAAEGKAVVTEVLLENPLLEEQQPAMADLTALTSRQRQILELVCEGLSNAQIAKRLFVTESTIKQHLRTAYKLLNVRNRVQAANLLREA